MRGVPMMKHPAVQIIFRILFLVIVFALGLFLLYHFLRLTYPFLIAALLAFLINPIVNLFVKYLRFPRPLAVLASLLFLFGVIGSIVAILVKKTIDGVIYLLDFIPKQIEKISISIQDYFNNYILPLWDRGVGFFDNLNTQQQQLLQEGIQIVGSNIASLLKNVGQSLTNGLTSFISALPITFTVIVFIILAIYFISKDMNKYTEMYKDKLPDIFQKKTWNVLIDLKSKIFGFFKSQIILMMLTFFVSLIGLLILRTEYALTLALTMGLLDLIPYFGPGLIIIPWSIYNFFTGDMFMGVGLLILYASTVVVRQFAEPKVLSSSMKLNPLAVLVSLFAGLQMFGLIGLVIGPITLVLIISLYDAKVFEGLWGFIKGDVNAKKQDGN